MSKIKTLKELREKIDEIEKSNPNVINLPLFVFDVHGVLELYQIESIDETLTDRVDINIYSI